MALDDERYRPGPRFYMTDAITDHAIGYLENGKHDARPFFLYLAYTAPHDPLHAPPEDIARYRGRYREGWDSLRKKRYARMQRLGLIDPKWALSPRPPESPAWDTVENQDYMDLSMSVYAAMIDRMDRNIGRLLDKLHETGADRNTLILFLSDNGACAEYVDEGKPGALPGDPDSNLSYGLPWACLSNTPFRMYKQFVHEGGIATPLIAHWPGRMPKPGGLCHAPGHIIDIMATCLEAAGATYPTRRGGRAITPIEGRSLLPLIEGRTRRPHPAIFWNHEGNRAVRAGDWKLVSQYPGPWELYNLASDRTELNDRAAAMPSKVRELERLYSEWAPRVGVVSWETLERGRKSAVEKKR